MSENTFIPTTKGLVSAHKSQDFDSDQKAQARTNVGAASSTHVHGSITNDGKIGSTANLPVITGASGVVTVGSFGTSASTFCEGNDSRLSDSRTPVAHSAGLITSGTLATERLPSNVILVGADGFQGFNLNASTGVMTWGQLESADSWGQLSWDTGKAIIAAVTRLTLQASYLDVECTVTKLTGELSFIPASSVSLSTNGQLGFWKVSDTQLGIALRGSDGTTRTTILTLS